MSSKTLQMIIKIILVLGLVYLFLVSIGLMGSAFKGFGKGFAEDATYFDDVAATTRLDGKQEIINYFSTLAGLVPEHDFELVDPKVQVYGDIAILTLHYHGSINDTAIGQPWKATSIYRFQEGDWKVVHAHWSVKE